jgi:cytochrome c-550 PedF
MLAQMKYLCMLTAGYTLFSLVLTTTLNAHGDVTPQAVDVSGLPKLGKDWREENPWRDPNGPYWKRAIEVGASGYNQNCARCHGLGGVSGGLAPDMRYLEANVDGDEWYVERYRMGYTQNGVTKMPAFDELLGQEAAWAIRTYIETRADEDALAEHLNTLNGLRDELRTALEAGSTPAEAKVVSEEIRSKLETIAAKIMTASGAPIADSVASEAARLLDGSHPGLKAAAESLTIGLSAAK